MTEAGGRRIKRSIFIDMSMIRFLGDHEIDHFGRYELLREYIENKKNEIAEYNAQRQGRGVLTANARRLTNLGIFRAYILKYLQSHPMIHKDMTIVVRQLQPTAEGMPLEIYGFVRDTRMAHFEMIQADIFDHILAVIGQFGLRVFQQPSSSDVQGPIEAIFEDDGAGEDGEF